jgi:hypothetical protein
MKTQMKWQALPRLLAGLATILGSSGSATGHALIVDVDTVTPGIQSSLSVMPGAMFTVDIHLVDDGSGTAMTGYGFAINFNDTPGVLGIASPTVAGPFAGTLITPADLITGPPVAPGVPLSPAGVPPFGIGPGGAFTASNGGTGYFESLGAPLGPNPPFALPGATGMTVLLQSLTFMALGTPGTSSDIAPLGILAAGPPPGSLPPIAGPGGVEFYDNSGGAPGGLGGYGAIPVGPFGPNPSFPLGSPGLAAITPGTVSIIPEPHPLWLAALTGLVLLARKRGRD